MKSIVRLLQKLSKNVTNGIHVEQVFCSACSGTIEAPSRCDLRDESRYRVVCSRVSNGISLRKTEQETRAAASFRKSLWD